METNDEREKAIVREVLGEIFEKMPQAELARRLSVHPGQKRILRSAVSQWEDRGKVPDNRVRAVSEITGKPLKRLYPSMFDPDFRAGVVAAAGAVAGDGAPAP